MRMMTYVLLLLASCLNLHNIAPCAEEDSLIIFSAPQVQATIGEEKLPATESNPRIKQTGKEWESYLADIGKFRIVISLDGFKLRNVFVQGNATFNIIYQFYLGYDYHPKDINLILGGEQLDSANAAKVCLSKWTLKGFITNRKYRLVLHWEHNKGYTTLTMTGDEMNLSIRLKALI